MLQNLIRRLGRSRCLGDTRGSIAISAALIVPVAVMFTFGAIDYSRSSTARRVLQDKIDAAALVAARSSSVLQSEIQSLGSSALTASMAGVKIGTVKNVVFALSTDGRTVTATAEIDVPTSVVGMFTDNTLTVSAKSEIVRQSSNLEVSLVLDMTASMAGSKIADLKVAAADLVDLVVQDVQTPFATRVALVPYSNSVNVGSYAAQVRGTYTSGTCTSPGCEKYKFYNEWWDDRTHTISTCATERSGTNAYTEAAPSTEFLGRHYPASVNPCPTPTIVPLSSNKTTLKTAITNLSAGGSSGGHVGIAWGWYMVSPNFSYLWPSGNKPAAYKSDNLIKAVIIMTDGEYNTVHCNGVIAKDSTYGSGSDSDQINCNSPNGNSYYQSQKLCTSMKAQGVVVYTVGFDVEDTPDAKSLVSNCATSSAHVYLPETGTALKSAFKAIAQDIAKLRVSK